MRIVRVWVVYWGGAWWEIQNSQGRVRQRAGDKRKIGHTPMHVIRMIYLGCIPLNLYPLDEASVCECCGASDHGEQVGGIGLGKFLPDSFRHTNTHTNTIDQTKKTNFEYILYGGGLIELIFSSFC